MGCQMDTNSYYLHFPFFLQESPPKSIHVSYVTGESAKLKYKSKVLDFDNALKRSHWEKNASLISRTDKISFGINKNKRKFWLKIKKVDVHDSGIYSFVVNGKVLRLWQLNIQGNIMYFCVMYLLISIIHQLSKVLQFWNYTWYVYYLFL